jgi:hypothetical protein
MAKLQPKMEMGLQRRLDNANEVARGKVCLHEEREPGSVMVTSGRPCARIGELIVCWRRWRRVDGYLEREAQKTAM